uniref:Glutathione transferase n=1 Tax=Alexandrium monilatum TaxID=311494 RepID=A0A7S4PTJ4_9DINO
MARRWRRGGPGEWWDGHEGADSHWGSPPLVETATVALEGAPAAQSLYPAAWIDSSAQRFGRGRAAKGQPGCRQVLRPGVWQLIYWPCWGRDGSISAGAGRAEYVRLMFEEAGVPYEEVEDAEFVRDFFWRRCDELQPAPVLAPPAVHKDGFVLSQTAAIVRYLARKFGMMPDGGVEAEARADQLVETVHEMVAEARLAYHPDHQHRRPYRDQREAAEPYIRAFERSRLPRLLGHFERLLAHAGEHFVGGSFSYADVQVFALLRVAESQFPRAYAALDIPLLRAFLNRTARRPRIAAYLASDRSRPFAGDSFM